MLAKILGLMCFGICVSSHVGIIGGSAGRELEDFNLPDASPRARVRLLPAARG